MKDTKDTKAKDGKKIVPEGGTEAPLPDLPKKRGRPVGSGGNTRKDLSFSGNENLKPGDNNRFLRHALASWDLPPIDISDKAQVEERIVWFFNHCAEDDMKPTVTGLCNALGISRATFYTWTTGQRRGPETSNYVDLIKRTRGILEELWEDYMVNGKINPVTGIFLGKNHFGYQDKTEYVLTPGEKVEDTLDVRAIRERYLPEGNEPEELPPPEDA